MFEGLTLAIEMAAIGLSAFPWILVVVDLLYPRLPLVRDFWSGGRASWYARMRDVPGLAALGFLVAYFLALIITPVADEFFNYDWNLGVVLSKADDRIRVERYFKEYRDLGKCWQHESVPEHLCWSADGKRLHGMRATDCYENKSCLADVKRVYDKQKYRLLAQAQQGAVLKDLAEKLVALRGAAWNGIVLLFASLGGLLAARSRGQAERWKRCLQAAFSLALAASILIASVLLGNVGGDAAPAIVLVLLASACGIWAAWQRTMIANWTHYLPFCALGLSLAVGGVFGVQWLEKEYDKHVILFSVHAEDAATGAKAAGAGQSAY